LLASAARRTDNTALASRPRFARWPRLTLRSRLARQTLLPDRTLITAHAGETAQPLRALRPRLALLADRTGFAALAPGADCTGRTIDAVAHQGQLRRGIGRYHLAQSQHLRAHLRDRCPRVRRDQFAIALGLLAFRRKDFAERFAERLN
jgi:hypothetical protein